LGKKLLIERDPYESRVAVLEDDRAAEVYLEDSLARDSVGNIYKGKVKRVLPGIQAAFVEIGLEREAFLYVADACARGRQRPAPGEAATPIPKIQDLVEPGMELLVQVIKASVSSKGARITTEISLPGRLLVLLPKGDHIGLSRRIEDTDERERLRSHLEELLEARGLRASGAAPGGLIVRTVAEGRDRDDLSRDLEYLSDLWASVCDGARKATAPALVHDDLDLARRALRDLFNESFDEVFVQDLEGSREVLDFLDRLRSPLRDRVFEADRGEELFETYKVNSAISSALRDTVWLKSGGYLVIHSTEALVAIDVNTGRFVGRREMSETILRTNLEAAHEAVRQIRLRDLSGIIVIDFIDMLDAAHQRQVVELVETELEKDRSKSQVLDMSSFGLVEITRERGRKNLRSRLTVPCPNCHGSGRVASPRAVCLNIRRSLWRDRDALRGRPLSISVHPAIARALEEDLATLRQEVERELDTRLEIQPDTAKQRHEYEIIST